MGIIKAFGSSLGSMAADQWKEFFYCDSIPADQIMVRGSRHASAQSVNNGNQDIITDGSIIAVADGQCAVVVSNGRVIAVFRESGEHEFRTGETAGIFSGAGPAKFGKELMRRISFGGDAPAVNHRIYYINMKVIPNNRFGSGIEVPVRVRDAARNIDIDCMLVMSGSFAFRIYDPEKIYKQVIGNVKRIYPVSYLAAQMQADVDSTLLSAAGTVCGGGFRPYEASGFIPEIQERVMEEANTMLRKLRGIELTALAFDSFRMADPDTGTIRTIQLASVMRPQ